MNATDAQLALVVFLSILLDLFAAFFVGLIGEELRYKRSLANHKQLEQVKALENEKLKEQNARHDQTQQLAIIEPEIIPSQADILFQQALDLLNKGDIRCSKKAIGHVLEISSEEVNEIFTGLLEKGFVSQKANRHFNWHGQPG